MSARARRRSWVPRTPGGWVVLVLVAVLLLGQPVLTFFWPVLQARSQFASLTPTQQSALMAEVAARRVAGFPAFDAEGAEVTVAQGSLIAATPGPCTVAHDRWPHPNRPRTDLWGRHVSGRATFHCLFALEAEGHGPLRAVVRVEYLTNPPDRWAPSAPLALGGDAGRRMIAALERVP